MILREQQIKFEDLEADKEYILIHHYGQPSQRIKITSKRESQISVIYVSDDCTKGMRTDMNRADCEASLREMKKQ